MKSLNIELDEYRKLSTWGRIFNLVFGTGTVVLAGVVIYNKIVGGEGFWEYFIYILMLSLGLYVLLLTSGILYRLSRRYVIVNGKVIDYKLSYFYPSRTIRWEELVRVDIRTLRIIFFTGARSSSTMKLGELFYNDIRRLKETLAHICTDKGIEWSDTTVESDLAGHKEFSKLNK